jgi:hypothetical protein
MSQKIVSPNIPCLPCLLVKIAVLRRLSDPLGSATRTWINYTIALVVTVWLIFTGYSLLTKFAVVVVVVGGGISMFLR